MQTFSREYEKGDSRILSTIDRLNFVGLSCICDKCSWEPGPRKIECASSCFSQKQLRLLRHLNFTEVKN